MKKKFDLLYYFLILPFASLGNLMVASASLLFFILTFVYVVGFEVLIDQDIFQAKIDDIQNVTTWRPRDNTKIYDRKGKLLSEQFNEYHIYLPYKEIPQKMIDAVLAIEDRKFFKHPGIDVYGIMRAALSYFTPKNSGFHQGASTITQQVVKNLLLTKDKTITRKVREIVLSLYLESVIDKEKILEIYCNSMFLGNGAYGVAAAAKRIFGKELKELDWHETALIAGLFQAPGKYNPFKYPLAAKKRQLRVLKALGKNGNLIEKKVNTYKDEQLVYKKYKSNYGKHAPYFVDYAIEQANAILSEEKIDIKDSGLNIYTSLDLGLQQMAEKSFEDRKDIFSFMSKNIYRSKAQKDESGHDVEGALLAVERKTGKIVALVGGRDYQVSQFNRAIHAKRAPGSLFKTLTFTEALRQGVPWNKRFYVSPVTVGNYRPHTESAKLFTETTLLHSFYKSINSTAVSLGVDLGVANVIKLAKKLGVETPLKEEASTLLGGSEVSMLDLARVYSVFNNKGNLVSPQAIERITTRDGKVLYQAPAVKKINVLDENIAALMNEGLKTVVKNGTGYRARYLANKVAAKTGTSNQSKDNWFCGYTDDLVIVVWLGSDQQNSFKGRVSASNTAVPLWSQFAQKAIRYYGSRNLSRSARLESAMVHPRFGHLDKFGVRMHFLPGTKPVETKSDLKLIDQGESLRVGMNEL